MSDIYVESPFVSGICRVCDATTRLENRDGPGLCRSCIDGSRERLEARLTGKAKEWESFKHVFNDYHLFYKSNLVKIIESINEKRDSILVEMWNEYHVSTIDVVK